MKVYHVSDLHIHHDDSNNVEVQKRISALRVAPEDVVVITGDITDDGSDEQYRKAFMMLKEIPCRVLILPGNHDMGFAGTLYDTDSAIAFDAFADKDGEGPFIHKAPVTVQIENVLFILLNSCLQTESPFDLFCGEIGEGQLSSLDTLLNTPALKGLVKVVALHHHPFFHSDPTMRLVDSKDFIKTIWGRVDVMLFGHRHLHQVYKNVAGCKYALAAGALYQENTIDQITIEGKDINLTSVTLLQAK
jgi:3',5'-cyclic AMP phosphodiesterase CpdA